MRGLTRYVLRQTMMLTLAFTLVFTAAVWLVQSLRLIDLIVNRGLSLGIFFKLAVLILPRFIEIVLPIAIFLAVLFSYNRLISESELIVMRASGLSQMTLSRPALILAGCGADTSGTRPREAEELYFHELVAPGAPGNLTPEIHLRLIMPIDALVFALIPLACLLPGDFNRRGQSRRILAATILAMLFEVV